MKPPLPSDDTAKLSKFLPLIPPLMGVLITGIFLLDLLSPLGRVAWLLYFLPLFLTFWFSHRQCPIPLPTVCMALIMVGFIHTSPGSFQPILAGGGALDHNNPPLAAQGGGGSAEDAHDRLELLVEGNAFAARSPTRRCSAPSARSKG